MPPSEWRISAGKKGGTTKAEKYSRYDIIYLQDLSEKERITIKSAKFELDFKENIRRLPNGESGKPYFAFKITIEKERATKIALIKDLPLLVKLKIEEWDIFFVSVSRHYSKQKPTLYFNIPKEIAKFLGIEANQQLCISLKRATNEETSILKNKMLASPFA